MGALDILKSERGLMTLFYLGVLAVLLFMRADKDAIDTWAMYAGGVASVYNVAKSITPGARSPAPGTTTSSLEVKTTTTPEVAQ